MEQQKKPNDFKGVGVLHFGAKDKSNPMRALKEALKGCFESYAGFLIVLPEVFNQPGGYYSAPGLPHDSEIKDKLLRLSIEEDLAFVVGLIEDQGFGPHANVAYLLDGRPNSKRSVQLSWKFCESSGSPHFCSAPVEHCGFAIASLICNDYMNVHGEYDKEKMEELTRGRNALMRQLAKLKGARKILCVPSASSRTWRRLFDARTQDWLSGTCVAAANGDSRDGSFISGECFVKRLLDNFLSISPEIAEDDRVLLSLPL